MLLVVLVGWLWLLLLVVVIVVRPITSKFFRFADRDDRWSSVEKRAPNGWLGYIRDDKLPNYMGIFF